MGIPTLRKSEIIEKCEICNKDFILNKNGFNLITHKEPFKGYYHKEIWICNSCYLKMLEVNDIKQLWKYYYNLMFNVSYPFHEGINNLERCNWCGGLYPKPDKRFKFCSDSCFKEHRRKYKRDHERKRYHKLKNK